MGWITFTNDDLRRDRTVTSETVLVLEYDLLQTHSYLADTLYSKKSNKAIGDLERIPVYEDLETSDHISIRYYLSSSYFQISLLILLANDGKFYLLAYTITNLVNETAMLVLVQLLTVSQLFQA